MFVNGQSLQSMQVFLIASLDLGYHAHPPLFMLSPQYFFHFFGNTHLLKHHGLLQTHIHFHVLEMETPKFPRISNLSSSSFSIFSIPIFPT